MLSLPVVKCARCGHEVQRFEMRRNISWSGWEFTVWCHGEQEFSTISEKDLQGAWEVVGAIAFRQPEQIGAAHE